MGFKLPGKSIQTGTSGHSSALKMVTEQRAASALKMQASPMKAEEETFSQAYRKNRNAGENTFTYKGKSYTTESRSEKEARGNKGEYVNKRRPSKIVEEDMRRLEAKTAAEKEAEKVDPSKATVTSEGKDVTKKLEKISEKRELISEKEKLERGETLEDQRKRSVKSARKTVNEDQKTWKKSVRKSSKQDIKEARAIHGRGSDEVKQAKLDRKEDMANVKRSGKDYKQTKKIQLAEARLADLEGGEKGQGGKRTKFLGNIRRKTQEKRIKKATKKRDNIQEAQTQEDARKKLENLKSGVK